MESYAGIPVGSMNAIKGQTVRYAIYPALVPANIATTSGGVKVECGNGAWSAWMDLVAADAIAVDFWIAAGLAFVAEAIAMYDLQLANAADAVLAEFKVDLTAVTTNIDLLSLPFPIWMVANAQVQVHGSTSGGAVKDIYVGILYATLL